MKKIKNILIVTLFTFLYIGCQVDEPEFGEISAPTNLEINVVVANDNSGNVTVTPIAQNAISYHVIFIEGAAPVVVGNGETAEFRYTQSGQYEQVINVIAYGRGGASSSKLITIALDVVLTIDQDILQRIAGDGMKSWVWDSENAGHFGVGDPAQTFPDFFSATPNQLNDCLYDDKITFSYDANNNYGFLLEDNDATFTNWAEIKRFFPDAAPQQFQDECRDIEDQIALDTEFVIITNEDDKLMLTVNNSTMSYWSGAMEYEIIELTDTKLVVRGIQDPFDPPGNQLAWYHTFVPENGGGGEPTTCSSGFTGATGSGNNDVLVWADEFDVDGSPCDGNWDFDFGNGNNGWGNGELQFYTDRLDNARVENGNLIITAKTEDFAGFNYTSARLKSKEKVEFTYGKVEIRAKLPSGAGTWPALWMLGADIDTNPWPGAGEIDIMEHVGNQQNRIFSTLHFPGNSGGNAIGSSTIQPGVSDDFHVYSANWTATSIDFAIDGNVFYSFPNDPAFPFDKDFFMLINVAMGGSFGGAVDPNFVESSLELDYIRVYQ